MAKGVMRFLDWMLVVCFLSTRLAAQNLNRDDSCNSLIFTKALAKIPGRFNYKNEFDFNISVSGNYFINGPGDKTAGQLAFLQRLKYKLRISSSRFEFTNDLVHNLGMLYYIDSISKVQTDENTLTTRLSYEVTNFLQFTASSVLTTRIFNAWDVLQGSGGSVVRTINSSFLTPLICTFSGGLGFNFRKTGMLDIGISSAKLTYIRDRNIFDKTGRNSFYGIVKGRNNFIEYGLSLHLFIDRLFGKKLQWNCDLLLFKADRSPVDMTLKNLFAYRINRFLTTSLQTRLFYDEDVNRQLRMENMLSFGFDFHL